MQTNPEIYRNFMRSLNPSVGNDAEDLILRMLSKDPKKRLSVDEIKKHPWYTAETSTYKEAVIEVNEKLLAQHKKYHGQ